MVALDELRPRIACDLRVQLRFEADNLEALPDALADIGAGRVHLLGFNDHTPAILRRMDDAKQVAKYAGRAGIPPEDFRALIERVAACRPQVPAARARLAAQLPLADKLKVATHVIDNSGSLESTRAQVERLYRELRA